MRERGLKLISFVLLRKEVLVAPHAGAWIEMQLIPFYLQLLLVAPHAGAWIEIHPTSKNTFT